MTLRTSVFGPAYLDRVLRIDRPLIDPAAGSRAPIDQSVEGSMRFAGGSNLELIDPAGLTIEITLPPGWPGPFGRIELGRALGAGASGRRAVLGSSWSDDLGGMGAGYAAALAGTLHSAIGPETDPISQKIETLLNRQEIPHTTIRVPDHTADWTLLVSSGEHGDKLPIGFRGCHAAVETCSFDPWLSEPCDLRVVAALPNHLAAHILAAPGAGCRVFAPAMRNMPRPGLSCVKLCRSDRSTLLQPPRVGDSGRSGRSCLESVDPRCDGWAFRKFGPIHNPARRAGHSEHPGISPRPPSPRYKSRGGGFRGDLPLNSPLPGMAT